MIHEQFWFPWCYEISSFPNFCVELCCLDFGRTLSWQRSSIFSRCFCATNPHQSLRLMRRIGNFSKENRSENAQRRGKIKFVWKLCSCEQFCVLLMLATSPFFCCASTNRISALLADNKLDCFPRLFISCSIETQAKNVPDWHSSSAINNFTLARQRASVCC